MRYKNITDIFFDLDHTLWDFDKNSKLAFISLFKNYKIKIPINDFIKVYEPINFEYWKRFREERITKEVLRRGRLLDAFKHFNIAFKLEKIDLLAEAYIAELPINNYLFEGAIELLEYLHKKYKLHIITNGFGEVQHLKLKNSNINHFFNTITTSEEVGVKKPNPLVFKKALEKANTKPENSIMIGDTFEADILGAESVNMHTLFFNYRMESFPRQYKFVKTLSEIKKIL